MATSETPKGGHVSSPEGTASDRLAQVARNMADPNFQTYDPSQEGSPSRETKFLAAHADAAQNFSDSTKNFGGASMFLHNMSMPQPGDKVYIVGKENSKKTGKPVDTAYENPGESKITPRQFAFHFNRLKTEAGNNPKAMMGSWFDSSTKKGRAKGVQIDMSTGHAQKKRAEDKMLERGEDAIWNMKSMRNVRNEAVRKRRGMGPR